MTTFQTHRIAVLSDLHAFAGTADENRSSWLVVSEDQSNPRTNPFASLRSIIDTNRISCDLVLCCGDLGDKANPEAQQYAWREVTELLTLLKAKMVFGAAGNHDVDSRYNYTNFDARGQLQALRPFFPINDRINWLEYWAKHYTIREFEGVRFVLLNSSAYHGYQNMSNIPEYEHGRVSDRTIDNLRSDLDTQGERPANVIVCHHHPFKNDRITASDYSDMQNGDRLLNMLALSTYGPWLIVHGHKHLPRVLYAPGGNSGPTIFSTGSFSAKLYPEYEDIARNEFYILELQVPDDTGHTSSLRGKMTVWQWSYGNGWVKPKSGKGLGPAAAFGSRVDLAELATDVAKFLKSNRAGQSVPWLEIIAVSPKLEYLIPEDLRQFCDLLKRRHQLKTLHDERGEIAEIQVS